MNKLDDVFSHEIYDYMAARQLNDAQMKLWWYGMSSYCKPTRVAGQWLTTIPNSHQEVVEALKAVFSSESGHEMTLDTMAEYLIAKCEVRTDLTVLLSQQKRLIAPPLKTINKLLAKRNSTDPNDTADNLGTMLGIECLANQNIIPGEVKAFVDSGHYKVTLKDPEMRYLDEHYGDLGAESWHQATLERISQSLGREAEVLKAERVIYQATAHFYESMLNSLKVLR